MKIKELILENNDIEAYGLKNFKSSKFNSVIALVGKNGAGKSRYLKAIENKIINYNFRTDNNFIEIQSDIYTHYKAHQNMYDIFFDVQLFKVKLESAPSDESLQREYNLAMRKLNNLRLNSNQNTLLQDLKRREAILLKEIKKNLKIINSSDLRKLQAGFDGQDGKKVSFQEIIDSTLETIEVNEFEMINESALTFLNRLPHKLAFDDIDCKGDAKKFKSRVSYKRYKLLSDLIREFLNKELEWHSQTSDVAEHDDHISIKTTGYWTINSRTFNYNDFSDGEKVLFTYAILLFLLNTNTKINFKDSIIIIDEPELNLHPKAQIKLIQSLENLIKETGQLIIATHSLSILANLDYGSIFLVKDNELISPSSSVPFNAIDELMGFEEHYNKIVEFLVSTPSWAMTNFMAQCFENPEVFESANKNDPQLDIFKNLILNGNNLNILDFGSGKGRLLELIKESNETWNRIQKYDCLDTNDDYNDLVLAKGANDVYNKLKDIPNGTYDIIVIVNVLHEIHIEFWKETFTKIKKALKPKGFLAIIEDTQLPIGELPNDLGFLLLEKEQMKILLGNETNYLTSPIDRYKDRIICSLISREKMNLINKDKLIETLEALKKKSLLDIEAYRKETDKKINIGRLYALKANSYVNSQLALNYLNSQE